MIKKSRFHLLIYLDSGQVVDLEYPSIRAINKEIYEFWDSDFNSGLYRFDFSSSRKHQALINKPNIVALVPVEDE
jgi:hypothetical protein